MPGAPATHEYDNLFRGAARVGALCAALQVPWVEVVPAVARFSPELNRYLELSVDAAGTGLGLMTRGEGKDFTFRVVRTLEERGVEERVLRRLLATAWHFENRNVYCKIEYGPAGIEEVSWYVRRRPSLGVALSWLASHGAGPSEVARVTDVAAVLGKATVHFLGTSVRPPDRTVQKVYFSQPDGLDAWTRIRTASRILDLADHALDPVARHLGDAAAHACFASVALSGGRLLPGFKIDVVDVPVARAESLARAGGVADPRLHLLATFTRRAPFHYLGIRLAPGEPIRCRAYVRIGG